ncbi:hypothetical protein VST7929_01443 [Vibrio stylophorae]|uniref:Uncharacterized protein n=1 Tax=Vibrio stylophorae TaxID=659351 RepID=A0ABM8ZTF8_9VIBR|nr:hypothetical protein VST7929_01443 [Vibrio stylophorae]
MMTWAVHRNSIAPDDLKVTLSLTESSWKLALERADRKLKVDWGTYGFHFETELPHYRHQVQWPDLQSPSQAVQAIAFFEQQLGVTFLRKVFLQGSLSQAITDRARLAQWLGLTPDDFN